MLYLTLLLNVHIDFLNIGTIYVNSKNRYKKMICHQIRLKLEQKVYSAFNMLCLP